MLLSSHHPVHQSITGHVFSGNQTVLHLPLSCQSTVPCSLCPPVGYSLYLLGDTVFRWRLLRQHSWSQRLETRAHRHTCADIRHWRWKTCQGPYSSICWEGTGCFFISPSAESQFDNSFHLYRLQGTGFSLWKTVINYESRWEVVEPVFHRLRIPGTTDRLAGVAFQVGVLQHNSAGFL